MTNKLFELTAQEFAKQRDTLNLIASENYPSPKVLELLGSVWMNKYAEGTPGKRYYAGNVYADEMETFVQPKPSKSSTKRGSTPSTSRSSRAHPPTPWCSSPCSSPATPS
jgi:hypothetical protein